MPVTRFSMVLLALGLLLGGAAVRADGLQDLKAADLDLGQQLIVEHKCNECHARKWTDDGLAIYRPGVRIDSAARLLAMVESCNTELGLGLFPEDVAAVAAVLNRDHYRFTD